MSWIYERIDLAQWHSHPAGYSLEGFFVMSKIAPLHSSTYVMQKSSWIDLSGSARSSSYLCRKQINQVLSWRSDDRIPCTVGAYALSCAARVVGQYDLWASWAPRRPIELW